MIIYNVTVSVEEVIKEDWLIWMQDVHIPEVMATGIFSKSQINRVIVQGDSDNTFAIAYTCENMKDLHQYQVKFAPYLQKKHSDRYGAKAVAFRTLMEVVQEF
ncbi:MAG: Uncharacterised protein [Cryomorphaceae bacterium]|nr:MAG: Uncharacterised protein [Cryomorphaceae bacterium]